MKATEIQCGDIILVDGKPTRVYGVMERMNRIYDTMTNDISLKRCSGMPITPEILEKNGWENEYEGDFDHETLGVRWCIRRYGNTNNSYGIIQRLNYGSEAYILSIHYVHELQHWLRLIGEGTMADNFKI